MESLCPVVEVHGGNGHSTTTHTHTYLYTYIFTRARTRTSLTVTLDWARAASFKIHRALCARALGYTAACQIKNRVFWGGFFPPKPPTS